jgi:uncharacterized protein
MLYDRAEIKGSARITKDGYFVADALVARANNIQDYLAAEIGLTDRDPKDVVRVFRPAEEVFHRDAMASLAHRPITLDHPSGSVTASNWKRLAVGDVGDEVVRDGEFIRVPIKIMDADAITSVAEDRREFSLGYSLNLDMTPGEFEGRAYDAVAREFRYNHLAAVRAARGGTSLRIIDERTYSDGQEPHKTEPARRETSISGGSHVATKTITFDGLPLEVTDAAEAAITKLQNQIAGLTTDKGKVETDLADVKTKLAASDAEIVTLKKAVEDAKVTPAQLRDQAKAYSLVCDKAKALEVKFAEDADASAIMKAVVEAKMGDTAKGYDDKQIAAAFDVLTKDAKVDPVREALSGGVKIVGDAAAKEAEALAVANDHNSWRKQA